MDKIEIDPASPPVSLARNIPLLTFWIGQSFSMIGSRIYALALAWEVIRLTGSSLAMASVLVLSTLPVLSLSLFGGVIGDRLPKRRILTCCDGLCAIISFLWSIWLFTHAPTLGELYGFALFIGCTRAFFLPAYRAVLPELIAQKQISRAVSLNQLFVRGTDIVSPILGGFLVVQFPFSILVLINGLSYGIAFLSNLALPTGSKQISKRRLSAFREFGQGWNYFIRQKALFWSIAFITLANFGAVTIDVNLPKFIQHDLTWTAETYGSVLAGYGLGTLLSYLFFSLYPLHSRRGLVYLLSLCAGGIFLVFIPFVHFPWELAGILVAIGITFSITSAISSILLQELTEDAYRSRIMGLVTITSALTPLGYGFWGIIGDIWGNLAVFIGAGLIIALIALFGLSTSLRKAQ